MSAKRRERRPTGRSSRKILGYALIGITALGAVSALAFIPRPAPIDPAEESRRQAILQFQERFCGLGSEAESTSYLTEFSLPDSCEMPLAIEDSGNNIWYVSTKNGTLGSFDVANSKFGEEYRVPSWPTRTSPTLFSMSWSAKADSSRNVWFSDERQQVLWKFDTATKSFNSYPVNAKLPASIDFDSNGKLYFVGIQSSSIFIGNPAMMRNGTSGGITEFKLPLDGFSGIDEKLITTGSLVVDKERNSVWVALLAFQQKGQLFQYDIGSANLTRVVTLPPDIASPVGVAVDRSGNLWGTDHGTNIFFKYDLSSGEITKFVTSVASPRIYGGIDQPRAYTLPYWIERNPDSNLLWFNQHTGNKISKFDPEKLELTEYWIPSQNPNWANCPENAEPCGLANALQITAAGDQAWFTEWTENKIGHVDGARPAPISVTAEQEEVTVRRGDSAEIRVQLVAQSPFAGNMIAATSLTANGRIGNSTGIFSENSVSLQAGSSKDISFILTPASDVAPGKYTLMVGAEDDAISIMKVVMVNIV